MAEFSEIDFENQSLAGIDLFADSTYVVVTGSGAVGVFSHVEGEMTFLYKITLVGVYHAIRFGNYIIAATLGAVVAYNLNDGSYITDESSGSGDKHISTDGTYLYVSTSALGLEAWSFDGATLTCISSTYADGLSDVGTVYCSVIHGSTIMASDSNNRKIHALTFDGSNFALVNSIATVSSRTVTCLASDGTYIYASYANAKNIHAYSYLASTLALVGTYTYAGLSTQSSGVAATASYIYSGFSDGNAVALSFNGATFTLEDTESIGSNGDDFGVSAITGDVVFYAMSNWPAPDYPDVKSYSFGGIFGTGTTNAQRMKKSELEGQPREQD